MIIKQKKSLILSFSLVTIVYLLTHLWGLTKLPVFADEAIYIRWAQLIMDDFFRYLFFPLNDGKTPLFIWSLIPFQFVFQNQLYAARFVSVLVGLLEIGAMVALVKSFGGRTKAQWLTALLTAFLPFWFFHQRMALIDLMLTLWFTLLLWGSLELGKYDYPEKVKTELLKHRLSGLKLALMNRKVIALICISGISLGLALWTKITAILFFPILPIFALTQKVEHKTIRATKLISLGIVCVIGLFIFAMLKISPAFPQLFSRGGDFLYPFGDVLFKGGWQHTLPNIVTYLSYFLAYLSWPVIFLNIYGLFSPTKQRQQWLLFFIAAFFAGPIMLFGKVVYPRYFLPIAVPLTISAVLSLQEITDLYISRQKNWSKKLAMVLLVVSLISVMASQSLAFIIPALTNPNTIPFVSADKVQYLTEWSSGHGIVETVDLIESLSQNQTIAVATEGYFGTLPDGLVLYLHRTNVDSIFVDGIGQPVNSIPQVFKDRAIKFDRTILVVNSHRMQLKLEPKQLIAQYCRPYKAPCLQVWDITDLIKTKQ